MSLPALKKHPDARTLSLSAASFATRRPLSRCNEITVTDRERSKCDPNPRKIRTLSSTAHRTGPDDKGFFGLFGGRFVAETLMPLILDLERAYEDAKADPTFQAEIDYLNLHYGRPPEPSLLRRAHDERTGRRENLLQARRAQSHRLAQDQQLPRPDPARSPHGQEGASSQRRAPDSTVSP